MAVNVQRYTVNSKTLVGQIVPFFLRGKRMLQFLSAISSPLDSVNKTFQTWAHDTLIDAVTTSQVIVLKWSLKNKLYKYLTNTEEEFDFDTYDRSNYATLYENQSEQLDYPEVKKIYMPEDSQNQLGDDTAEVILRNKDEIVSETNEVLIIAPPHNSKISDGQYIKKIKQCVEPYIVYNVEYKIVISKSNK